MLLIVWVAIAETQLASTNTFIPVILSANTGDRVTNVHTTDFVIYVDHRLMIEHDFIGL